MVFAITLAATLMLSQEAQTLYDFKLPDIDGKAKPLSEFKGKVVLVVNTASQCGLTPQYEGLEALYRKYRAKGFLVAGFPCNDFGEQEPGTEAEIKQFCATNYKVTFPMFSKVHVNGASRTPLYAWLLANTDGKDIEWNFAKFLVGKDGRVLGRFSSRTKPEDPSVVEAIEAALAK